MAESRITAVLFDLDGTIADTAPDLAGALNAIREEEGLAPLPLAQLRPLASQGVRGLLRAGMNIQPEAPGYPALAERVLAYYEAHLCVATTLFPGVAELLRGLRDQGLRWGVVTNKHARFTAPLMRALAPEPAPACIVSGDTTGKPKPAPEPLWHACTLAGVDADRSIYVGDDRRDILAAHAAGMPALAAAWGYLGEDEHIDSWGAEAIVQHPRDILAWLDKAL